MTSQAQPKISQISTYALPRTGPNSAFCKLLILTLIINYMVMTRIFTALQATFLLPLERD